MADNVTVVSKSEVYVPAWFFYLTGSVLSCSSSVCISTNSVVLYVFYVKNKRLRTRTTQYVCALCTCDLFIAIFALVLVISSCFAKQWLFGRGGCVYYGFIMTFFGISNIYLLSAIAFDRYLVIVKTEIGRSLTTRSGVLSITICFVISLIWAVCPLLGWSSYSFEGVEITCTLDHELEERPNGRSYLIAMLVVCFLCPLSVIIFSYCCVFIKVVKESKSYLRPNANQNEVLQDEIHKRRKTKMEKDLTVTIGIMIGAFLVCWSPFAILLFWRVLHPTKRLDPIVATVPALIAKTSICFNPVIYLYRNRPFRNTVVSIIPCLAPIFTSQIFPVNNRDVTTVTAINERYIVCSADDISLPEIEETRPKPMVVIVGPSEHRESGRNKNAKILKRSSTKEKEKSKLANRIFHVKPASESNCISPETVRKSKMEETYM